MSLNPTITPVGSFPAADASSPVDYPQGLQLAAIAVDEFPQSAPVSLCSWMIPYKPVPQGPWYIAASPPVEVQREEVGKGLWRCHAPLKQGAPRLMYEIAGNESSLIVTTPLTPTDLVFHGLLSGDLTIPWTLDIAGAYVSFFRGAAQQDGFTVHTYLTVRKDSNVGEFSARISRGAYNTSSADTHAGPFSFSFTTSGLAIYVDQNLDFTTAQGVAVFPTRGIFEVRGCYSLDGARINPTLVEDLREMRYFARAEPFPGTVQSNSYFSRASYLAQKGQLSFLRKGLPTYASFEGLYETNKAALDGHTLALGYPMSSINLNNKNPASPGGDEIQAYSLMTGYTSEVRNARLEHTLKMQGSAIAMYDAVTHKPVFSWLGPHSGADIYNPAPLAFNYDMAFDDDDTRKWGFVRDGENPFITKGFPSTNAYGGWTTCEDDQHYGRTTERGKGVAYWTGDPMVIDDLLMLAANASLMWAFEGHHYDGYTELGHSLQYKLKLVAAAPHVGSECGRAFGWPAESAALALTFSVRESPQQLHNLLVWNAKMWTYYVLSAMPHGFTQRIVYPGSGGSTVFWTDPDPMPATLDAAQGIEGPIASHGAWCSAMAMGRRPPKSIIDLAHTNMDDPTKWTDNGSGGKSPAHAFGVALTAGGAVQAVPLAQHGQGNGTNHPVLLEYAWRLAPGDNWGPKFTALMGTSDPKAVNVDQWNAGLIGFMIQNGLHG